MTLHLHANSPLHEIQSEFAKNFPRLKLDFIFHGDEKLNLSSQLKYSFLYAPVEEFYPDCATGDITIDESMTTKEAEDLFENYWHLPAKIYADIDGYWQKNRRTECSLLREYILPALKN